MAGVTGGTMSDRNAAFVGEIPANYDRFLGPLFFHGFADDLAARLPVSRDMRVLETACGTGIVTRRLADRIRGHGSLVATDLNEAMIAHGRANVPAEPGLVEWRPADATKLPFPDRSFDAVVCQFGLMFFPDKVAGVREAFRVLKPGGRYLFNVWDAIAHNPGARIAHETTAAFFPVDPPTFYTVPFSLHDPEPVRALLDQAGFMAISWTRVEKTGSSPSSTDAATGLIDGNPILGSIMERRPEALGDIRQAVAAAIAAELGDRPVRAPLRALVFSTRRP
jgi:ubiquinone/menaquinone biosynthesis C-methylase UbiE